MSLESETIRLSDFMSNAGINLKSDNYNIVKEAWESVWEKKGNVIFFFGFVVGVKL